MLAHRPVHLTKFSKQLHLHCLCFWQICQRWKVIYLNYLFISFWNHMFKLVLRAKFVMNLKWFCASYFHLCLKPLGPLPNVDIVLSICLQSDLPVSQSAKPASGKSQMPSGPSPSASDPSGAGKSRAGSSFRTRERQTGKRKDSESKLSLRSYWVVFAVTPMFCALRQLLGCLNDRTRRWWNGERSEPTITKRCL